MSERKMPALTDDERIDFEQKQLANVLAKVNSGQTLTPAEQAIVNAAHARSKEEQPAAPPLFLTELGFEVAVTDALEKQGINDASRLIEQKPEVFRIIASLLARAVPVRDICNICGVSAHTVQSVGDHPRAELPIATQKAQFIAKLRLAATLGLEALIERFKQGEVTAVEFGIIADKLALAEGGVTERSEIIIREEDDDEYTRLYKQARAQARRATGMVIDSEESSPTAPPSVPLALGDHHQAYPADIPSDESSQNAK